MCHIHAPLLANSEPKRKNLSLKRQTNGEKIKFPLFPVFIKFAKKKFKNKTDQICDVDIRPSAAFFRGGDYLSYILNILLEFGE